MTTDGEGGSNEKWQSHVVFHPWAKSQFCGNEKSAHLNSLWRKHTSRRRWGHPSTTKPCLAYLPGGGGSFDNLAAASASFLRTSVLVSFAFSLNRLPYSLTAVAASDGGEQVVGVPIARS